MDQAHGLTDRATQRSITAWFAANGRDLPWRRTRDPWAVLISECMLQQTQVGRVVERLPRFLDRFPSPAACAGEPVGAVIEEWAGLGYNRRAVAIHQAATIMVGEHDGVVPSELSALLRLPGIGAYTARAVRAFAFEHDDGVVDTNIARVLARFGGEPLKPAALQALADDLVPAGEGWVWNQALMEIGALLCRPTPACGQCPLSPGCRWRSEGMAMPDPARGSAGVSKGQSAFEGSDRQGRGRLVDALRRGPISRDTLPGVMGWHDDEDRAARVAATLLTDGLAVEVDGIWTLP